MEEPVSCRLHCLQYPYLQENSCGAIEVVRASSELGKLSPVVQKARSEYETIEGDPEPGVPYHSFELN